MHLSQRLMAIANFVHKGSKIADIGTDHAYLPIFLVKNDLCPNAVGGDVHRGPFEAAVRAVQEAGLADKISVRQGDGLAVVQPGEVDIAVIAGMGGGTIRGILEASPQVVEKLERLILQPMVDSAHLREWLLLNGWKIADEELVEEEGRLYEIIVAEKAGVKPDVDGNAGVKPDAVLLEAGPRLVEKRHPLLRKHLDKLIQDRKRVLDQIRNSKSPLAKEKAEKTGAWITRLRELRESLN